MVIKVAPIVEGIDDTSNNNDTISKKKGKPKVAAMMNIRLANSTPTRRSMAIIYKKSNPNSPKEAGRKLAVEGRTRASNLYSDSDDDSSTTPVIKKRDISTRKRLETLSNHPERPIKLEALFLLTLSKLKQEESAVKAIVLIQKHIRGTLARWNLRVLKLERKKEAVEALKQKQLKKLNQRSKQKMLAFRIVMEHEHQHRVKMRHLRRATILKELFKGQSTRAEQEQCDLYKQIQELTLKNEELEDSTKELEDQAKKLEPEVAALEATKEELKDICNDYKLAIEIWKGKMEQLFSSHSTEKRRYS